MNETNMRYQEFKQKVREYPLITRQYLDLLTTDLHSLQNQLVRWQKRNLIIKLKRGVYLLNKDERAISPSRLFIANQLYYPSYVSCEYALGYYDLIPERVVDVTSVTTRKTISFKNELGTFRYQHIKEDSFIGFKEVKDEAGLICFLAEPEKAVVDFLYLNLSKFKRDNREVLRDSCRFQNIGDLKKSKIKDYARMFKNKKLLAVAKSFCQFMKEDTN